jgi:hypothetical protein
VLGFRISPQGDLFRPLDGPIVSSFTTILDRKRKRLKQVDLTTYIRLRLLVGYLGEKSQHGWWSTDFLSAVARPFLEPSFPRTWRVAQYTGVTEAARRVHDEHIGIGNVFHLFRLPEELERQLHAHLLANLPDESPFSALSDQETAVQALKEFSAEGNAPKEGPISVGTIDQARDLAAIRGMVSQYKESFQRRTRVFPYFVGDK